MFRMLKKIFMVYHNSVSIGIIKMQLRDFSEFNPYDDSSYDFFVEEKTTSVIIKCLHRPDIHEKYVVKYDNETKDFTITPNDLGIKKGSIRYWRIKRAVKYASKVIQRKHSFFTMVNKERKQMAEMLKRINGTSIKNVYDISFDYGRKIKNRNSSSRNSGMTLSMRDKILYSDDSSSSRDFSPSSSNNNID